LQRKDLVKMMCDGPVLQDLMQRISKIPDTFFLPIAESIYSTSKSEEINIPAVISDLIFDLSGEIPSVYSLSDFMLKHNEDNSNFLRLITICVYLFSDAWFSKAGGYANGVFKFLRNRQIQRLAEIINYKEFINDMERREELVRLCLDSLNLFPQGENRVIAKDRLTTLDSIERKRIIEKSRKAQERSRQLREAMARKKAQEAASKMSRE